MRTLLLPAALASCVLVSCKDDEIRTYRVASNSENTSPAESTGRTSPAGSTEDASASVTWQAPSDWKQETATQFLTAAYTLPSGGRVTISKLPGDGGGLAANINRWRGQLGFKPVAESEIVGQPFKVAGSDKRMQLFNLTAADSAEDAQGILAAVLPLDDETWYFKFSATVGVLRKTESVFAKFLSTVRIGEAEPSAPEPPATGAKPIHVTPPDGWTASNGSSMRAASFGIAGPDGASADVSVIPLPGDAGSVLDNVNRWRSQLELAPLASADDPALGKKEQTSAGELFISHMTSTAPLADGKKAAIGAAILKRPGMTWFFKITGEASLVEANLEKFDRFVHSATFPE